MTAILIIDDDPLVRLALRVVLEAGGYAVTEADNGKTGLALFKAQPTPLVVTDLFMPDMEGFETIRALRTVNPAVKIIALSGGGEGGNLSFLDFARKLGADAALAKPFEPEAFKDIVRHTLNGAAGVTNERSTP